MVFSSGISRYDHGRKNHYIIPTRGDIRKAHDLVFNDEWSEQEPYRYHNRYRSYKHHLGCGFNFENFHEWKQFRSEQFRLEFVHNARDHNADHDRTIDQLWH